MYRAQSVEEWQELVSRHHSFYRDTIFYAICMGAVFAFSYVVGKYFDLYKVYWWFDIPMHFVGGFLSMGFACSFLAERYLIRRAFVLSLGVAFAIFTSWEILEYFQIIGEEELTAGDTLKDFCMDSLGAFTFYGFRRVLYIWRY